MGKIWVEVCLISARGLLRTSSFWKLQWFAVGWIDPNNKYCTKINASGNANPVWKTKFAALIDDSNFEDLLLHVEVFSREPLFLKEKLQGTAIVSLKEFLSKYKTSDTSRPATEEVGSYQLRKKDSNKPQGFVDISVHISEEGEGPSSQPGNEGEIMLTNSSNTIASSAEGRSGHPYPTHPLTQPQRPAYQSQLNPYSHPVPLPANYSSPSPRGPGYMPADRSGYRPPQNPPSGNQSGYHPPQNPSPMPSYPPGYYPPHTPPPPLPPANAGYVPTFIPRTETYINMPSSGAATGQRPRGHGPAFGVGVGAGALAAGAVIFGDDYMSGYDFPTNLQGPSLAISIDPPF